MKPENLEIRHLASVMKTSIAFVLQLAENPRIAFHPPRMRPVKGKMRLITAPRRKWKMPYQWLGDFIRNEFPLHPAAHGSVPGRSPFTMGRRHIGPKNILSRDVKSAFPSVESDRFYLQLLAMGFRSAIAQLLTKLLLPDGYIPQGGPASNAAIDLYFYRIDCDIAQELSVLRARYTRFTDNLDVSFLGAGKRLKISAILQRQLSRLGLQINQKKMDESGFQPRGTEHVLCGVRVDSPRGTQLPTKALAKLIEGCESLYRGATCAAPHTLTGLARRRRALQGWLNQASQADIAPVSQVRRRLRQVDFVILGALNKEKIYPHREWYTCGNGFDTPAEIGRSWYRVRHPLSAGVA